LVENLIIVRGSSLSRQILYTDTSGSALDLTGKTIFFTIRKALDYTDSDDSSADFTKDITSHSNPAGGISTLELTETDTLTLVPGEYYYDLVVDGGVSDRTHFDGLDNVRSLCIVKEGATNRT